MYPNNLISPRKYLRLLFSTLSGLLITLIGSFLVMPIGIRNLLEDFYNGKSHIGFFIYFIVLIIISVFIANKIYKKLSIPPKIEIDSTRVVASTSSSVKTLLGRVIIILCSIFLGFFVSFLLAWVVVIISDDTIGGSFLYILFLFPISSIILYKFLNKNFK